MKSQEGQKSKEELSAIEKIRKLMEFSTENGATESEVENAMKAAQRLMMKFNLEQDDVKSEKGEINFTIIESTWKDGMEAKSFEIRLLNIISRTNSCKAIIYNRHLKVAPWKEEYYKVCGETVDREVVVMTFQSILAQIRAITKRRYKESDKSLSQFRFTTSYQSGFLVGLNQKLQSDKESFLNMSMEASEKASYELMIVSKDTLVQEFLDLNTNLKTVKNKQSLLDKRAYTQGIEDGSEKGLNKQLGQ